MYTTRSDYCKERAKSVGTYQENSRQTETSSSGTKWQDLSLTEKYWSQRWVRSCKDPRCSNVRHSTCFLTWRPHHYWAAYNSSLYSRPWRQPCRSFETLRSEDPFSVWRCTRWAWHRTSGSLWQPGSKTHLLKLIAIIRVRLNSWYVPLKYICYARTSCHYKWQGKENIIFGFHQNSDVQLAYLSSMFIFGPWEAQVGARFVWTSRSFLFHLIIYFFLFLFISGKCFRTKIFYGRRIRDKIAKAFFSLERVRIHLIFDKILSRKYQQQLGRNDLTHISSKENFKEKVLLPVLPYPPLPSRKDNRFEREIFFQWKKY